MRKIALSLFILPLFLVSCSNAEVNKDVEKYYRESNLNQSEFTLSPDEEIPSMDKENYWYFGVWINNKTSSPVTIDMKTGMKIFYKVEDGWIRTKNHDLIYENTWTIPPNTIESPPWTLLFVPNERHEDITFRMFIIGYVGNNSDEKVVGAMEYVIKNNNLEEINSLPVGVAKTEMSNLFSKAVLSCSQFTLSQSNIVPMKDEEGYWLFELFINNFTDSNVLVGLNMGLKIFYQDNDAWYEINNHEIIYQDRGVIPPKTIESKSSMAFVRPNIQREDLVFRIFVIGSIENSMDDRVAGMIEYVIKDDQLVEVNTIE